MFQSLFWWNDLMRIPQIGATHSQRPCFNPCSGGMTLWVYLHWRVDRPPPRFNPCSGGMTLWVSNGNAIAKTKWFQSLFWWNDLMSPNIAPLWIYIIRFQSLFWWNDLMRLRWGMDMKVSKAEFQSLFWWNDLMRGLQRHARRPGRVRVSILVLVEWPYEKIAVNNDAFGPSFNPCSGGMTLWAGLQASIVTNGV